MQLIQVLTRILGPYPHRITPNNNKSFPAIILGQIKGTATANPISMDMESISSLVAYLSRFITGEMNLNAASDQDKELADSLGLADFLVKKRDALYYKAINITKQTFNILLIRPTTLPDQTPVSLQWVAIYTPP